MLKQDRLARDLEIEISTNERMQGTLRRLRTERDAAVSMIVFLTECRPEEVERWLEDAHTDPLDRMVVQMVRKSDPRQRVERTHAGAFERLSARGPSN
jgi:hypothetical protein